MASSPSARLLPLFVLSACLNYVLSQWDFDYYDNGAIWRRPPPHRHGPEFWRRWWRHQPPWAKRRFCFYHPRNHFCRDWAADFNGRRNPWDNGPRQPMPPPRIGSNSNRQPPFPSGNPNGIPGGQDYDYPESNGPRVPSIPQGQQPIGMPSIPPDNPIQSQPATRVFTPVPFSMFTPPPMTQPSSTFRTPRPIPTAPTIPDPPSFGGSDSLANFNLTMRGPEV